MTPGRPPGAAAVLVALGLTLAVLLSGCGGKGGGVEAPPENPPRSELLAHISSSVNADRMMETVRLLSSADMRGRPTGSPQNQELTRFFEESFRELGLQPLEALGLGGLRQDFEVPSSRCFLEDPPAEETALTASNVIGVIPGAERPDDFVVFTANFDGMGVDGETGEVFHGADFNATGAAAVLELARVMSGMGEAPPSTMVFAELNAGECGHFGAKALAEAIEEKGLRGRFRMIDMEGLGAGEGDYMDVWDLNYRKNQPAVRALDQASSFLGVTLEINGSDSGSASSLFFVYHMACVTCDWSWFERSEHPDYHKSSDTADRIREDGLLHSVQVVGVAGYLLSLQPMD